MLCAVLHLTHLKTLNPFRPFSLNPAGQRGTCPRARPLSLPGFQGQWHRQPRHQEQLGDDDKDQINRHQSGPGVIHHGIGLVKFGGKGLKLRCCCSCAPCLDSEGLPSRLL